MSGKQGADNAFKMLMGIRSKGFSGLLPDKIYEIGEVIAMGMRDKNPPNFLKRTMKLLELLDSLLIPLRCEAGIGKHGVLMRGRRTFRPDKRRGAAMFSRWIVVGFRS